MNNKRTPKRTQIEEIKVAGQKLTDEQLRLVAGMVRKTTYLYTRGPLDVYQD